MPLLGLEKIIWLPGIKGKDITDGHTDFYARFAKPGVVLAGYDPDPNSYDHAITLAHLDILQSATDAQGKPLEVLKLEAPTDIPSRGVGINHCCLANQGSGKHPA
ncbi:MAG: agmatine deiminase family protein [Candidatus Thiothrix putei]|uniref:Agmatine deiminase family protein n=1 Tax=Candidatus Thiothrix putei TaxID=3080811 RepID=A0AA95HHM3_9GAMM|nr:MAG: agmatine deiminase family protein [Candidatus Thiothrix putei]